MMPPTRRWQKCASLLLAQLLVAAPAWSQAEGGATSIDELPEVEEETPPPEQTENEAPPSQEPVSSEASSVVLEESEPSEAEAAAPPPSHAQAPSHAPPAHASTRGSAADSTSPVERPAPVLSAGIDPSLPQFDDAPASTRTAVSQDGEYRFEFHGFLRSPMRMGLGPKNDGTEGLEEHSPPRVPDLSFTDWRYTHNVPGPWTQLLFSYGNERVKGTVGIAAFNHTNASYRNLQANLGINEAFLTIQFPGVFGRYGGLVWNVGSFSNRYGTAGKYNAGRYNTYLFGRTRISGETLTAGLHLTKDIQVSVEHGIGAKLDVIPFESTNPRPEYLPYGGPEPQGTTWVNHAHATMRYKKLLTIGGHYLRSRSPDDRQLPGAPSTPGHMTISGAEARFDHGAFGHAYLGYSHIHAHEVLSLADSIEVLHSFAGWNFKNNFFGRFNPRTGESAPDTSGKVDSLLFQYDLSLGALARYPTRFRGNGPDLNFSVFGMFNKVTSENNSHSKFKWGAELLYEPFSVMGFGARYDLVQPDMRDADQSFAIVSPKIVFTTQYITKERVTLQYSRYFLGDEAYPAFPYADIDEADPNVFMIVGRMWW